MNLSSENLRIVNMHNSIIANIYHFPDNDSDHFVSLSKDSELNEWMIVISDEITIQEISQGKLERPKDNYLLDVGIQIDINKSKQKFDIIHEITKSILFNNIIAVGYEDGLVLIWSQKVKYFSQFLQKKLQNNFTETINEDDLYFIENLNSKHKIEKKYKNEYNLDLILHGNKGRILDMFYYKRKNILITSGDDCVIKFWDLKEGISLYHFNLDSAIDFILIPNGLNKLENLFLISLNNCIVKIDLANEPFNFNTSFFKFNKINSYKDFNAVFLLGKDGRLIILDSLMKLKQEVIVEESSCSGILFLEKWRNFFILLRDDKKILLVELNEKKMKVLFKIELGCDVPTSCLLENNILLIGTRDKKIIYLNILQEYELFLNRFCMLEEEKSSVNFNCMHNNLAKKKNRLSAKNKKKKIK